MEKIDGNIQKTSMHFFNKSEAILDIKDIIYYKNIMPLLLSEEEENSKKN